MITRRYVTLLVTAALASACAINPMTPTSTASATLPPVVAVRVATDTPTAPPSATVPLETSTASEARLAEPTDAPPTPAGAGGPATAASVLVAQATLPPELPATVAPPVATAIPPVQVAPPPSADVAAAEQYCIDLINVQRANAGLGPLERHEIVMGVARARVADMVARGYTGHNDPVTGASLGSSMLSAAGFGAAGENWYGSVNGPPAIVDVAMGWFMTDAPHYRNILSTRYSYVGVGIAFNGRQWLLIQNFAGN